MARRRAFAGIVALVALASIAWLGRARLFDHEGDFVGVEASVAAPGQTSSPAQSSAGSASRDETQSRGDEPRTVSDAERIDAIARAQIWRPPRVPVAKAYLGAAAGAPTDLSCRFHLSTLGGTTPKFDCLLDTGERIRIKYGRGPEIPSEAAATRLVNALGFGADEITLVANLRCYGCPAEPFSTMKAVEVTRAEPLYRRMIDYTEYQDFDWVALERKFDGRPIETSTLEGWAFFELDKVDASKGGAPRAHVDALRLLAVFLAHWDNKSENQRLVCLSKDWPAGVPCPRPFLMIQDVGATFGPSKVDLEAWERAAVWEDRARCTVSMRDLPYDGATFGDARIGEAGRRLLGSLLTQLSDRQLADLFAGARFDKKHGLFRAIRPVADWVRVFQARTRAIIDGPACPAA